MCWAGDIQEAPAPAPLLSGELTGVWPVPVGRNEDEEEGTCDFVPELGNPLPVPPALPLLPPDSAGTPPVCGIPLELLCGAIPIELWKSVLALGLVRFKSDAVHDLQIHVE